MNGPLAPACMQCERVTGNATCFPGPCVFYHESKVAGTKSHAIATLDRIRRNPLTRLSPIDPLNVEEGL